jgi:hypothetical protein
MKAFIGRLGVPSSRLPGGAACLRRSSGLGLVDGVMVSVASERLGEAERTAIALYVVGTVLRTERRMSVAAFDCAEVDWSVGLPSAQSAAQRV